MRRYHVTRAGCDPLSIAVNAVADWLTSVRLDVEFRVREEVPGCPPNGRLIAESVRLGESMAGNAKRLWCGLMAIKPFLDKPYPDDPRWTPWTRFVEWELERLMTDAEAWRKLQRDGGDGA